MPARILIGAGVNAQGTGLDLATGAGAALERLDHQWNYPRGVVDPRYPGAERGLNVIFGTRFAWLNGRGERIWAERVADMLAQPGGRVVLLFDVHGRNDFRISGGDWADRRRVEALLDNPAIARKADSLTGLAGVMGLPADAVTGTVERWNALVASGEDTELGLFSTSKGTFVSPTGVRPRSIVTPPFHAVEVWPLTRKSMGGVAIDMTCRVLDQARRPIPGLYAVGEVAGFGGLNGRASIEGAFIAPAMLQGRIAGRTIAAALRRSPLTASVSAPATRADPAPGASAQCSTCHRIDQLLASPRKGFWHFERVHARVDESKQACTECHADMSPFRAGQHTFDRVAQIDTCTYCHVPLR